MTKRSLGVFIFVAIAVFIGIGGICNLAQANGSILINEFAVSPSENQWIELINTSSSAITLSNLEARILSSSMAVNSFALADAVIPAGGLAVYDFAPSTLDATGGAIFLLSATLPSTLEASYGSVDLPGADHITGVPGQGQSASLAGGVWGISSSSKYWFNDASGLGNTTTPPALPAVETALNALGINTNIADLPNPLATDGLYFSKTNVGKIQFGNGINLSNSSIVNSIKSLTDLLAFTTGTVAFALDSDATLRNMDATITLYSLSGESYSPSDLIIKDNEGSVISPEDPNYPVISNFSFDLPTQSLSFRTNHFTSFSVPIDLLDLTPPEISFTAPTPADNASTNQTTVSLKVNSTENMSSAIVNTGAYANGDFEGGNFSSWLTGGGANWEITTSTKYSGSYSAKSGYPITDTSWIGKNVTVVGPSTLWFRWKIFSTTSSEVSPNSLKFFIDNSEVGSISNTQDWTQEHYSLTAGDHELKWKFSKGDSANSSTDAAWLDDLIILDSSSSFNMEINNAGSSSVATYALLIGGTQRSYQVFALDLAGNYAFTGYRTVFFSSGGGGGGSGGGGGGGSYFPPVVSNPATSSVTSTNIILESPAVDSSKIGNSGGKVLGVKSYANGSLLRSTTTRRIYILQKYQKKWITSLKELKTYKNKLINNVDDSVIAIYPDYRVDGTLIRNTGGKIYVIKNGRREHISTLKELKTKYRGKKIFNLSDNEVNLYREI